MTLLLLLLIVVLVVPRHRRGRRLKWILLLLLRVMLFMVPRLVAPAPASLATLPSVPPVTPALAAAAAAAPVQALRASSSSSSCSRGSARLTVEGHPHVRDRAWPAGLAPSAAGLAARRTPGVGRPGTTARRTLRRKVTTRHDNAHTRDAR